jgi:RHS repeat-associated protein
MFFLSRAVRLDFVVLLMVIALPSVASAQSETVEYYGLDALGSVRVIFGAQGNLIDRMDYGPFGENLRAAIKFPPEQFAQLARDAESGQDYGRARNYSWGTGRFNRPDPVDGTVTDPQSWNRYVYAKNCPEGRIDPEGLSDEPVRVPGVGVGVRGQMPADIGLIALGEWLAVLRPQENPGGRDGKGSKSDGKKDDDKKEKTDCLKFAEELGQKAADQPPGWLGQQLLAAELVHHARNDQGNEAHKNQPGPTGFQRSLTVNQEWDVFRHIRAHAGANISDTRGAMAESIRQMLVDINQWLAGTVGGRTEFINDLAAAQVGQIMLDGMRGGADAASIAARIFDKLCVK